MNFLFKAKSTNSNRTSKSPRRRGGGGAGGGAGILGSSLRNKNDAVRGNHDSGLTNVTTSSSSSTLHSLDIEEQQQQQRHKEEELLTSYCADDAVQHRRRHLVGVMRKHERSSSSSRSLTNIFRASSSEEEEDHSAGFWHSFSSSTSTFHKNASDSCLSYNLFDDDVDPSPSPSRNNRKSLYKSQSLNNLLASERNEKKKSTSSSRSTISIRCSTSLMHKSDSSLDLKRSNGKGSRPSTSPCWKPRTKSPLFYQGQQKQNKQQECHGKSSSSSNNKKKKSNNNNNSLNNLLAAERTGKKMPTNNKSGLNNKNKNIIAERIQKAASTTNKKSVLNKNNHIVIAERIEKGASKTSYTSSSSSSFFRNKSDSCLNSKVDKVYPQSPLAIRRERTSLSSSSFHNSEGCCSSKYSRYAAPAPPSEVFSPAVHRRHKEHQKGEDIDQRLERRLLSKSRSTKKKKMKNEDENENENAEEEYGKGHHYYNDYYQESSPSSRSSMAGSKNRRHASLTSTRKTNNKPRSRSAPSLLDNSASSSSSPDFPTAAAAADVPPIQQSGSSSTSSSWKRLTTTLLVPTLPFHPNQFRRPHIMGMLTKSTSLRSLKSRKEEDEEEANSFQVDETPLVVVAVPTNAAAPARRVKSTGDLKEDDGDDDDEDEHQERGISATSTRRIKNLRERRQKSLQVLDDSRRRGLGSPNLGAATTSSSSSSGTLQNEQWSVPEVATTTTDTANGTNSTTRKNRGGLGEQQSAKRRSTTSPPRVITVLSHPIRPSVQEIEQGRRIVKQAMESEEAQQVKMEFLLKKKEGHVAVDEVDSNCQIMKEAILRIHRQLAVFSKDDDLANLRQHYEEKKRKIKKEMTKKYEEETQKRLSDQLRSVHNEIIDLQNENKDVTTEHKNLCGMIEELSEENKRLELHGEKLKSLQQSSTVLIRKISAENSRLAAMEQSLSTIYNGAITLQVEPGVKEVCRKFMYKCGRSVHLFEGKDSALYQEVKATIRNCEAHLSEEILLDALEEELGIVSQPISLNFPEHSFGDHLSIVEEGEHEDTTLHERSVKVENVEESFCTEGLTDTSHDELVVQQLSTRLSHIQLTTLFENKDMLLSIFKFLDTDGSGKIDRQELKFGIDLLNRRLPPDAQFQDHNVLFETLDADADGGIDLQEFNSLFSMNYGIA